MKALILARVSTEEQKDAGNSLPAQIDRIERYCKRNEFTVIKTYSFDESAYKNKRDQFNKILEYLESMKEKVAVCFDKVDRLSRNIFDKRIATLYEKAVADQIELHFVSDGQIVNAQMSAVEKFHFGMSLGLAKYYSDAISDNVKRSFEKKRNNGEYTGKAPVGYLNIRQGDRGYIIPDKNKAPFIRKIFELYSRREYSMETLADHMYKLGLRSWNGIKVGSSSIERILKNPFYYGLMEAKGQAYPHAYQPLITRSLFVECKEVMNSFNKRPFKYAAKPFILRGLIRCDICGCTITAEIQDKYIYYSCTGHKKMHPRVYVREEKLLEPLVESLKNLRISESQATEVIAMIKERKEKQNQFYVQAISSIKTELGKIKVRIDSLMDLLLDKEISKEDYDRKLEELKTKQQELNTLMSGYELADEKYFLSVSKLLNIVNRAYEIFESSEPKEKRQILNMLFQNCRLREKTLLFEFKKPFDSLAELNKT